MNWIRRKIGNWLIKTGFRVHPDEISIKKLKKEGWK